MKLLVVLLTLAVGLRVHSKLQDVATQADDFVCTSDGVFPVPDECVALYYVCSGSDVYVQSCPDGYLFDPEILRCIIAEEASCFTPAFECPADGYFPSVDEGCTSEYWHCVDGKAEPLSCPEGELFDPTSLKCVAEDQACLPPPTFECPSDGDFPSVAEGCSIQYWHCVEGVAEQTSCPDGELFDPMLLGCVAADEACVPPPVFECASDGFSPSVSEGCSDQYWNCVGGVANQETCPSGQVFDPDSSFCKPSEDVTSC